MTYGAVGVVGARPRCGNTTIMLCLSVYLAEQTSEQGADCRPFSLSLADSAE